MARTDRPPARSSWERGAEMLQSYVVVMFFVLATVGGALAHLRRLPADRPPVGVFNGSDVATLLVGVLVMPFVYLAIPARVAVPVFGLVLMAIVAVALGPVLGHGGLGLFVAVALALCDVALAVVAGAQSPLLWLGNAVLLSIAVVGIANIWAQSGMRLRHLVVVTVAVTVYDTLATAWSPLTLDLFNQLAVGPFAPFLLWRVGPYGLTVGLGDLLIATLFVLLVDKGYGGRATVVAFGATASVVGAMSALAVLDLAPGFIPAMWGLAPVVIGATAYLARVRGRERTVGQYRLAAAVPLDDATPPVRAEVPLRPT